MEQGSFVNYHPILLPPLPKDIVDLAESLFDEQHRYLRLGKNINQILFDLSRSVANFPRDLSAPVFFRYALLTILQNVEGLTDRQSVEAVDQRVDLKYALHLPLVYPRFEPARLCEFRRQLFRDEQRLRVFQELLCQLAERGFFSEEDGQTRIAGEVLRTNCTNSRLDTVLDAFFQALETLAVTDAEWLRRVMLPHWYDRYNARARQGSRRTTRSDLQWFLPSVGQDIQYLLAEIERAERASISSLAEVHYLRRVRQDQFERSLDSDPKQKSIQFRSAGCSSCSGNLGISRPDLQGFVEILNGE